MRTMTWKVKLFIHKLLHISYNSSCDFKVRFDVMCTCIYVYASARKYSYMHMYMHICVRKWEYPNMHTTYAYKIINAQSLNFGMASYS